MNSNEFYGYAVDPRGLKAAKDYNRERRTLMDAHKYRETHCKCGKLVRNGEHAPICQDGETHCWHSYKNPYLVVPDEHIAQKCCCCNDLRTIPVDHTEHPE